MSANRRCVDLILINLHAPDLSPGKHLLFDTSMADTYRLKRRIHQRSATRRSGAGRGNRGRRGVTPLHVIFDSEESYRMWYQAHDPKLAEERRVTCASMAT